jgi:hypothetical protein
VPAVVGGGGGAFGGAEGGVVGWEGFVTWLYMLVHVDFGGDGKGDQGLGMG